MHIIYYRLKNIIAFEFVCYGTYCGKHKVGGGEIDGGGCINYLLYPNEVNSTHGDGNICGYGNGTWTFLPGGFGNGFGDGQFYGDGEGDCHDDPDKDLFLEF